MINIVAIEREYGSGAAGIAETLAGRLGWKLWDREFTCEIARRLKCDISAVEKREERLDPTFYRLMKTFMRGSYESSMQGGSGVELLDAEHLSILFERINKDIASKGNAVIVGRAAPYFLRDSSNACRVFIYAPYEEKLRRVLAQHKNRNEAEQLLGTIDQERAAFVKKYYGKDWPYRPAYHIMINSQIGDEGVIKMIMNEIELLNHSSEQSARIA